MTVRFLAKRFAWGVVHLFGLVTVVFFLTVLVMPGDYVTGVSLGMTGEQKAALRAALGLDQPLWERYLHWIGGLAHGDLGLSFQGGHVSSTLFSLLPWTLLLFTVGLGAAFAAGSLVGRRAGWRRGGPVGPMLIGSAALAAVFPPWLAFLMVFGMVKLVGLVVLSRVRQIDYTHWGNAPSSLTLVWALIGLVVLAFMVVKLLTRHRRMGVLRFLPTWSHGFLISGLTAAAVAVLGWWRPTIDVLGLAIFPLAALFLTTFGDTASIVEASMRDLREEDFVLAARAKGLTARQVRDSHAARVALLPAVARQVANLPYVLAGLVILESSFSRLGAFSIPTPGISSAFFHALSVRDTPMAMGSLVLVGVITLVARLGLDVAQAAIDPRIRYGTGDTA